MAKKFLYVLNPISGADADRDSAFSLIGDSLGSDSLKVYRTTGKEVDIKAIKVLVSENKFDGILVGGGDGTINMVGRATKGTGIPLGIIPLGSANGLAACIEVSSVGDTLDAVLKNNVKPVDGLNINGRLCLHLADFGLNASMIKKYDEGDQRGMIAYFKSSLQEVKYSKPYSFLIGVGSQQEKIEAQMLVIANGKKYGTQAIINPQGKMDDGRFELIALNPQGIDEMVALSIAFFRGTLDEIPGSRIWSEQKVSITNPDGAAFQIDGEVMESTNKVNVYCHPHEFYFFTP